MCNKEQHQDIYRGCYGDLVVDDKSQPYKWDKEDTLQEITR